VLIFKCLNIVSYENHNPFSIKLPLAHLTINQEHDNLQLCKTDCNQFLFHNALQNSENQTTCFLPGFWFAKIKQG